MALWDLAGKAYNVPAYQLLGGKYRDFIRLYADTPKSNTYEGFAENMKKRRDQGYTFLKMDFGIGMLADQPGMLVNANNWSVKQQWNDRESGKLGNYANTKHPFTRIQVTKKGLDRLVNTLVKCVKLLAMIRP